MASEGLHRDRERLQLPHDVLRADVGQPVVHDQRRLRRQQSLQAEGAMVADRGQPLRLRRVDARDVDRHQILVRAQRVDDLGVLLGDGHDPTRVVGFGVLVREAPARRGRHDRGKRSARNAAVPAHRRHQKR